MSLIVDASVAVKWVSEEPESLAARDLFAGGNRLIAPEHLLFEVANALRKKLARGAVTRVQATSAVLVTAQAFDELVETRPLLAKAVELAFDFNHAVYDCIYLALALRERAPLITVDQRLLAVAQAAGIEARLL